jgi:16S rRNA (cytosine1402-N4)-methyltransferase
MHPQAAAPNDHSPVMPEAAVAALVTDPAGAYVDGTFGRGGHARRILARLAPAGRLFAFDRDPAAATAAAAIDDPRFTFERTRFSQITATLARHRVTHLHGVLLDLGVSSPQFDDPARGFSLRATGPLDMRMDPTQGESAAQWLARADLDELTRVIRDYGEERFAVSIAKAIVARRADGSAQRPALATTADLAALVAGAIPVKSRKDATQHPATRTFQAVRIHVNQELEELAVTLEAVGGLLVAGGRLVVISFHSLEDRIVKQFIERHAHPERAADPRARRLPVRARDLPQPRLRALGKKQADAAEVASNPRARSAVMRVAERTAIAWSAS